MNFYFTLALRYLRGTQQERSLATMVKICFLGILISTFCLALVSAIMRGFEQATFKTLQGCHAPLTMQAHGKQLAYSALEKVFTTEFPYVSYSPSDLQYVMPHTDDETTINNLVALKGIDPTKENLTTILEQKILPNKHGIATLSDALSNNAVLMGYQLARSLRLHVGDEFTIYFVPEHEAGSRTITLSKATLTVGALFKTGIEEFDANLLISSLDTLHALFPTSGITSINIAYPATMEEGDVKEALQKRFKIPVYSWKDRYPALIAASKLETYASFIILSLIVLIASMSILSLLFMQITQKRSDIALLKIMGAPIRYIRTIFITMGILIALAGALIGLLSAFFVGLLLRHYICIELPDAYFISQLPVALDASIFFMVFIVVMAISFIATWLPTRSIETINCADVLRFET